MIEEFEDWWFREGSFLNTDELLSSQFAEAAFKAGAERWHGRWLDTSKKADAEIDRLNAVIAELKAKRERNG